MDIFVPIVICVLLVIFFSICGWCCRRKQEGTVYGHTQGVTVTTQHVQDSNVVIPPYPVGQPHHPTPIPQPQPPGPGFAHMAVCPPAPGFYPYPVPMAPAGYPPPSMGPGGHASPYPPTSFHPTPGMAPYPPAAGTYAPYPTGHVHPPSYNEAVSQPPPVQHEVYSKQSPYNPNY